MKTFLVVLGLMAATSAHAQNGVCVFKNAYSFPYKTNVETSDEAPTVEEACLQVLACLNNVMCIRYGEPGPKFGWILDSWEEN